METKVVVSFLAGVVPITWNAATGSQGVPNTLIQSARVYGCNSITLVTKVLFPASIPYLMTGIRLAVGRSLVAVLVAELYVSSEGLGRWIRLAGHTLSPDLLMFVALLTAFTGITFIQVAAFIERRFDRWKEDLQ
jgi:ABC-type nitrate/sulfonate/bicarbonate transport system permease component